MGKSKRKHPDVEEILQRPWCYYCERDFDDLKILISHQKAKHYKCDRCGRRLNTAGGLQVHLSQVHKENLDHVENALPNRQGIDIEIFGMEGIPEDVLQTHNQRVTQEFYSEEAARRHASGNPAPGANAQGGAGVKKPKIESPEELKKRLAEHKAKKAAEQAGSVGSGPNTPGPQAGSPQNMSYHASYPPPQASPPQTAFPQYGQQPPYAQQHPPYDHGGVPYGGPPPPQQSPFPPPGQHGLPPPHFPPPQHHGEPGYGMGYPPGPFNHFPPAPGPGQAHGASPAPQQQFHQRPPPSMSPAPAGPPRQNSLPSAPSLPQRPSFNAPQVSRSQLHEMHSGHMAGPGNMQAQRDHQPQSQTNGHSALSSSVDDLISSAQQSAQATSTPNPSTPAPAASSALPAKPVAQTPDPAKAAEKENTPKATAAESADPSKKGKKVSRMVYSDQQMSPEEKMAGMSRYQFTRRGPERVLGPVGASVTGAVSGPDDVRDAAQQ